MSTILNPNINESQFRRNITSRFGTAINWANPLTTGLVGFWPFNENGGTNTYDIVGNNNGTILSYPSLPSHVPNGEGMGISCKFVAATANTSCQGSIVTVPTGSSILLTNELTYYWRGVFTDEGDNYYNPDIMLMHFDSGITAPVMSYGFFRSDVDLNYLGVYWSHGTTLNRRDYIADLVSHYFRPVTIVQTYSTSANAIKIYLNGQELVSAFSDSFLTNMPIAYSTGASRPVLAQGHSRNQIASAGCIASAMGIWNRALSQNEIMRLHHKPSELFYDPYMATGPLVGSSAAYHDYFYRYIIRRRN